jgi:O-antigen ligase
MPKKFIEILIVCILIFAGIWMATSFVSLQEQLQIFGLIAIIALAIISIAFRKVPLDCKIICALILGYAFAGKGFAYITPVEPFYIGEIAWCVGFLGLFYRFTKGVPLFPNKTNVVIFLWMVTVGLFLIATFKTYGTLAIRDSAIGYYAMFAFYGYAIFVRNNIDRFFGNILKLSIFLGCTSFLILATGAHEKIISVPILKYFFFPHADAYLPLIAAGAMYGLLEGIRLKSAARIAVGLALVMILFISKTAGVFSFIVIAIYMIVIGRRTDLILTTSVSALLAAITLGLLIALGSTEANKLLLENEHLQAFTSGDFSGVNTGSTTSWRFAWWEIIFKDTLKENPLLGSGLGSDISKHFLQSFMRIDLNSDEALTYSRYPHNILFTVFGRMGFLGVSMFAILLFAIAKLLIRTTKIQMYDRDDSGKTVLLAQLIVIAGIANGFVQATYEIPYGAITHWFCLGYVIAYYQKSRIKKLNNTASQHP